MHLPPPSLPLHASSWFNDSATSSSGVSLGGNVRSGWQLSLPWFRRATSGAVKYSPILAGAGGMDLTRKKSDEFGSIRMTSAA